LNCGEIDFEFRRTAANEHQSRYGSNSKTISDFGETLNVTTSVTHELKRTNESRYNT